MRRALSSSGVVLVIVVACGGQTAPGDGGATDGALDGPLPIDVTSCTSGDDCVVLPRSCCGTCGAATPGDMMAVRKDKTSQARQLTCPGPVACPACYMEQAPELQARCASGVCQAFDARTDPVSACSTSADCKLRMAECCECGGTHIIAIATSQESAYQASVCPSPAACPKCLPQYPANMAAVCEKTGHCAVEAIKPPLDAGAD